MTAYKLVSTALVNVPNIFRFCQHNWRFKGNRYIVKNVMRSFNLTDHCIIDLMDGKVPVRIDDEKECVEFEYDGHAIVESPNVC